LDVCAPARVLSVSRQAMTLRELLTRALISRYEQWEWFRDCTLEKTIILCPDKQLQASLTRCWLPQIQKVMPGCEVRVDQVSQAGKLIPTSRQVYKGKISAPYQARFED
jgi:hypothetical protein